MADDARPFAPIHSGWLHCRPLRPLAIAYLLRVKLTDGVALGLIALPFAFHVTIYGFWRQQTDA